LNLYHPWFTICRYCRERRRIDYQFRRRFELLNGLHGYQISKGDLNYLSVYICVRYDIQTFILTILFTYLSNDRRIHRQISF